MNVVVTLLIFGALTILALLWVARNVRQKRRCRIRPWNRKDTIPLFSIVAMLPIQHRLVCFDASGGQTKLTGLLLTISQALLVPSAFWPWQRTHHSSSSARA